jgi:hypothetical protein
LTHDAVPAVSAAGFVVLLWLLTGRLGWEADMLMMMKRRRRRRMRIERA